MACTTLETGADGEHGDRDAAADAGSGSQAGGSGSDDGGDGSSGAPGHAGEGRGAGKDGGNAGAGGSAGSAGETAGGASGGDGVDGGSPQDAGPDAGELVDPCSADPAPCDVLQQCDGSSGDAVCGACPSGYVDAAPGICAPALLSFVVSTGVLEPAFDPQVLEYTLHVPLMQDRPAFKASVQSPIEIAVGFSAAADRSALESDDIWAPDDSLPLGTTDIDFEVHAGDRAPTVYRVHVTRGLPVHVKASNTGSADSFGSAVALSGDTMVVGAPSEGSAAQAVENVAGTSFTQDDDSADHAGAAYVFVLRDGRWQQQAYLKASNAEAFDYFGDRVAISGDRIVVGARWESSASTGVDDTSPGPGDNSAMASGAAYVFVRSGDTWAQEAYLKASNAEAGDRFGTSVAISGDTIVVGAQYEKSASTGINDTTPGQGDNSAEYSGAAYVFVRGAGGWAQDAYVKASRLSHGFGAAVAIDADTIVVGAPSDFSFMGGAYIFARSAGTWTGQAEVQGDQVDQGAGSSVAVSGDVAVIGAPGDSTSLDGLTLGAPASFDTARASSGAVLVLQRGGTAWGQIGYFKAPTSRSNEQYGWSVAVSGTRIVVGSIGDSGSLTGANTAPAANDTAASSSGAAFVYLRDPNSNAYSLEAYLKAKATHDNDQLGSSVAISPAFIAVGEWLESSGSRGVDDPAPGPDDISQSQSGAVYVY
jgi:hypothetical protein